MDRKKIHKIEGVISSHKFLSFSLLLISIITYILLSSKNIATFSYYEEDFFSQYFADFVVRLDENGRIWCDCKEFERSSCKKFGHLTFRECPPNISVKIKNSEIPILIAPHIGASAGLLLKLYIKILQTLGISGKNMKDRIILFRSFGIIVGAVLIILIFFITSKIFGHPAAGISSVLLSTNPIFILLFSSFSTVILLVDYLPVIVLLTISLAVSIFILRIRIRAKVILISAFVLTLAIFPFILYQLMYSGQWNDLRLWASPIKYAYHRLIPESLIKNFANSLIFLFLNNLPETGIGWWVLSGSGQNYTFQIIRGILIFIGFLNFILSEKNMKLRYLFVMLISAYVFLLSLFDISSHHHVAPSFILHIACAKGIAEFKIRMKLRLIPLYIPLVFTVILISSVGFIINSKKLQEANPDKLLEPKLQVVEFLIKNNIKSVVEVAPNHHIPIGILTDGKIKVVSYLLVSAKFMRKLRSDERSYIEEFTILMRKIFSLERNSVFIHGDYSLDGFYRFLRRLGFEVRELFRISVGKYYLSVFTVVPTID